MSFNWCCWYSRSHYNCILKCKIYSWNHYIMFLTVWQCFSVVCCFCDSSTCLGLEQEGIFRLSSSARVIERLKRTYEVNHGDVEFADDEDIMAIAGLMKLFLRELPDSIIPVNVVGHFLQLQAGEWHVSFDNVNVCIPIRSADPARLASVSHIWLCLFFLLC